MEINNNKNYLAGLGCDESWDRKSVEGIMQVLKWHTKTPSQIGRSGARLFSISNRQSRGVSKLLHTSRTTRRSISRDGSSTVIYPAVQTKLAVNIPGDKYEQEADRVAEQVMRRPDLHSGPGCCGGTVGTKSSKPAVSNRLQMSASNQTGRAESTESSDVNQVIAVPGRPLDPSTRGFMEARFGHDFGQVRVHSDAVSAASARQLGARAYTVGSDLVFGADQFSPQTFTGRRLLAHELVHTLQQGSSRTMVQRELLDCDDESCPERRASDEESWARGQGIRAEHVTTPETGFLVWGFPINSTSTAGLDSTPGWGPFWGNIVTRNVFWQVRGFTDCLGDDNVNMSLRHERARVARSALPSYAQDKVLSFFGAPLDQCIAVNTTKEGRHKNRSALFQMFTDPGREVTVATPRRSKARQ